MSSAKKQLLFISHSADRSGAPLILLGIIKEFSKQSDIPFQTLLMKDGGLKEDFFENGKTVLWPQEDGKKITQLFFSTPSVLIKGLQSRFKRLSILKKLKNTDIVFLNTIANAGIQEKLLPLKCRFIYYVHELEAAIHTVTDEYKRNIIFNKTDFFITGSEAVKRNLIQNHQVPEKIVKVVYSSMHTVHRNKENYNSFILNFKIKNNIPADAVIVGVAAYAEWRKGYDWFLPLVSLYYRLFPENKVYFVWKGLKENSANHYLYNYDYQKFNLAKRVFLLPHDQYNIEQIACFDIHLLLSREDPYPLVVLEAASLAIPTVCFSDAGGSPEFIENDCGYCVPYGDFYQMALSIHQLSVDNDVRKQMGLTAQKKVKERHGLQNATKEVIDIVNKVINNTE